MSPTATASAAATARRPRSTTASANRQRRPFHIHSSTAKDAAELFPRVPSSVLRWPSRQSAHRADRRPDVGVGSPAVVPVRLLVGADVLEDS